MPEGNTSGPLSKIPKLTGQGRKLTKMPKNRLFSAFKGVAIYILIGFAALIFFVNLSGGLKTQDQTPLSKIVADIKSGKIQKISIEGDSVMAKYKQSLPSSDGKGEKIVESRKEPTESIYEVLNNAGVDPKKVEIEIKDISFQQAWVSILGTLLPIILMVIFFFFIFRQAREGAQGIFSFGQSRAKIFTKDQPQVKFADVAGVDEAKRELSEVVDFLKKPEKYRALGAKIPKGVLLVGPAGTGKTLLSRAVAGEANVPFFSIAGSEFMEMLVGVGAARVRDMFGTAKKNAPAIIFIDEIESIGRARGMGMSGGHDEREQTLNQILVEMDGFTPNDHVIVIGASVTGDTPILVKDKNNTIKLMPIAEFVDQFYLPHEKAVEKKIVGYQALGFEKRSSPKQVTQDNVYFDQSSFKNISGVYRHKINEIYEIEYLGGRVRATGNHSVFIRTNKGLEIKPVANLKKGDILVDLPYKVNRTQSWRREIRAHGFPNSFDLSLPLRELSKDGQQLLDGYQLVLNQTRKISQQDLALQVGVSQTTIGNWQRNLYLPRELSNKYYQYTLPNSVAVTPGLCRLLGYYTAEGYARKGLDFCFAEKETNLIEDTKKLMQQTFGLLPGKERHITKNAINLVYHVTQLTDFFINLCGKGAHYKHVPQFLFQSPREFFLEYLKGVILGDGYISKEGKIEITSVSKQLILEINWLCRMHGIKSYIGSFEVKEGRRISNGKALLHTKAYRLGIGKHSNPFSANFNPDNNFATLPRIKNIKKIKFEGFVYDLCGMDNEAFFGGESPILLHNTNRPDLLDSALVRPGRFDRRVVLGMPDIEERKAIIGIHMKGKPFTKNVSIEKIARRTVGFSGADLANMLNEAAILAAREGKTAIDEKDVEEAATKEKLGPQRKRMQSENDRKLSAYHEAGHAVVGHFLKNVDPVHRISIVSRGMSGGHTMFPPTEDRSNETRSRLLDQITAALGGQAAEEFIFKDISTGASSDISIATNIARQMVTQYGMSPLGPINLASTPMFGMWRGEEGVELSPELQGAIDKEVRKIMDSSFKSALEMVRKHKLKLDEVAKALLEKETLESDEFEKIVGKKA